MFNTVSIWFYYSIIAACNDDASRFMKLLAKHGKSWLEPEDLVPLIQVVILSTSMYSMSMR